MLVDLGDYKSFLGTSNNTKDGYYTVLLGMVDAYVKQYVEQHLEFQQSIIEFYGMRTYYQFVLNQRPVVQIRNLWYDSEGRYGQLSPSFDPVTSLQVSGSDYLLVRDNPLSVNSVNTTWASRCGIVTLLQGQGQSAYKRTRDSLGFQETPSYGTIKVEYDAGFPVVPADLKLGVCMFTRALERVIPYGGAGQPMSEHTQKYSYALTQIHHSDLNHEVLLNRYRGLGTSIF